MGSSGGENSWLKKYLIVVIPLIGLLVLITGVALIYLASNKYTFVNIYDIKKVENLRKVIDPEDPEGPVAIKPGNNSIVDMTDSDRLTFSWMGIYGATHYKILLYEVRKSIDRPIFTKEVDGTFYILTDLRILNTGKFLWQIVAYEGDKILYRKDKKKYSFEIILNVKYSEPVIVSPGKVYLD